MSTLKHTSFHFKTALYNDLRKNNDSVLSNGSSAPWIVLVHELGSYFSKMDVFMCSKVTILTLLFTNLLVYSH